MSLQRKLPTTDEPRNLSRNVHSDSIRPNKIALEKIDKVLTESWGPYKILLMW